MLITLIGCFIKVDDGLGKPVPELPLLENELLPDTQGEPEVPQNFMDAPGLVIGVFL